MKKIILIFITLVAISWACIAPVKPLPPIGCNYDDAQLVYQGGSCYWVYMNCGK